MNSETHKVKKTIIRICLLIAIVVLILVGYLVYKDRQFHIVGYDPKLDEVFSSNQSLTINYNKPLSSKNLSVTSNNTKSTTSISGPKLVISLLGFPVTSDQITIDVKHVEATSGDVLLNKKITFQLVTKSYDQLSDSQKQAVVSNQDKPVYTVNTIQYVNFDSLMNSGVTSNQLQILKNAIFTVSEIKKQQFNSVTLNTNSVTTGPYDNTSDNPVLTVECDFTANKATYHAKIITTDLNSAQVVISQSDSLLFDSTQPENY